MHDLLVVLTTVAGFVVLIWFAGSVFDKFEEQANEKRLRVLNEFVTQGKHTFDHATITLIVAELRYRMSMTGEYIITTEHTQLLHLIARNLYILIKAGVRDQVHLLMVVCEQLEHHGGYCSRINITTNNRMELIVQLGSDERLVYVKFHSVNTIF